MTLTAGIYPDLSIEEYEADLMCPEPSLRSGHIKRLLTDSPAAMAAMHPRLCLGGWKRFMSKRTRRTDEGSIAHALILGRGCDFIVAEPEDAGVADGKQILTQKGEPYRNWSGKALEWREAKEALGYVFIGEQKNAAAETAKQAVWDLLTAEYGDYVIGDCEATVLWQRDTAHGPIWCRARLDLWAERFVTDLDIKSTELSISDNSIRRMAENDLWANQIAWQMEGLETVKPKLAGHLRGRFLIVQVLPPFDCCFFDPGESWLSIARQRNDRAANIFAKCLKDGAWPGRSRIATPEPSSWALAQFEDEEMQS